MNKLTFKCTISGYIVLGINCPSPSGDRCFKSKELAIQWIEDRCPDMYSFMEN